MHLRRLYSGFFSMLARTPSYCFCRKVLWFCLSRSLRAIKRRWARFGQSFAVAIFIKMIFVMKLRLDERRRSPMIILLCNLLRRNLSNVHNLWNFSCRSFKSWRERVTKAVSSLFTIFCYLSPSQIWSYELFLSTGTRKGTNMFNGPTNLRKFHLRKRDKSCSKDPYFLCCRTLRNGIELR